jgi:two-component system cell cycle sensor histidine kinase PleC
MMLQEIALRRSAESRLADALATSHEGVVLIAADGTIVLANRALREFFPAIADTLLPGRRFDETLAHMLSQLAPDFAVPDRADLSGHAEWALSDGRWVRLTASPTSEGGRIMLLSDFTPVKEREESLHRAIRVAEAANAAKTRFLANMSHELRTPLNAIIGFSEMLSGQIFGELGSSRYIEYADYILRSGRHLLDIINAVLDLAKSEAGKMALDVGPVDMRDVLNDCITMVRPQLDEAGLSFHAEGLDMPLIHAGDLAKLRQIFLNLLSNAVKFTARGGHVFVVAVRTSSSLSVTVGDTGIGMNADDVEIALQPFGQVDNRLERRYEGTGLGLPLTRVLVELHGGTMLFDSERGRGTRVIVTFPACEADVSAATGSSAA